MTRDLIEDLARDAPPRLRLWETFLKAMRASSVAEIGVYRGEFAAHMLAACPDIATYYMVDPWRHLDDWNKPANRHDESFRKLYEEAVERTREHARRRVILRGRTTEVIDGIPDGSLDFAYIDGDHTLRGITVDLTRAYPKVHDGGWIAGDDFCPTIWQHGEKFEPTLVFPYAVHFAEAVGARIYGLPRKQFLIEKRNGDAFEFVDLAGAYAERDLLTQTRPPAREPARSRDAQRSDRGLLRRLRDRRSR